MAALLTLTVAITLVVTAAGDGIIPRRYGRRCPTGDMEAREAQADVVFSGRVIGVYKNDNEREYYCSVTIYRVMKGDLIVTDLLGLPKHTSIYYRKTIEVNGFGDGRLCDSDVTLGDTRIFLLSYAWETNLTLSSDLVRIGIISLNRTSIMPKKQIDILMKAAMLSGCKFFFCSFYAVCKLGPLTGDPYCECPDCRTEVHQPVCGTDGNWYRNRCETRKATCMRRRRIKPASSWRCAGPAPTAPPIIVGLSSSTPNPLPKTDGATTTSMLPTTTMHSLSTPDIKDPCKGKTCYFGAKCQISKAGTGAQCVCPSICENFGDSDGSKPVCGNNDKYYANQCEMKKDGCLSLKEIQVKHEGPCDPCDGVVCGKGQICVVGANNKAVCQCTIPECTGTVEPVCGTDGKTYDNVCHLKYAACLKPESSITRAYHGRCKSATNPCDGVVCKNYATCRISIINTASCQCHDKCPVRTSKVCGSDGKDYDNMCELRRQACALQSSLTAVANGSCADNACLGYQCPHDGQCELVPPKPGTAPVPTCICPTCSAVLDPVCGDDGITYSSLCSLRYANCAEEKTRDVKMFHSGSCSLCQQANCTSGVCHNRNGTVECLCHDDVCVGSNNPVCADDGKTYGSMCELTVASCRQQKTITKVSDGACDGNQCKRATSCISGGICIGQACLCNFACSKVAKFVCGSDKQTYLNKCALEKASCETQKRITLLNAGKCSEKISGAGDGDDSGGEDGSTGDSNRVMETTTMTLTSDVCNMETNCKFGGQCDYTNNPLGVCRCDGFSHLCNERTREVCSSDGLVYKNICKMREIMCQEQREILIRPCQEASTPRPSSSPVVSLCPGSQAPVTDSQGAHINCSSCLPNRVGHCSLCLSDTNYCSEHGMCCAKDPTLPDCTYTQFGCCPDNKTLPSPGPDHRGCPYTCQCHEFGSNGPLCDALYFQCDCKPGVVGKTCNQCKPRWWGLQLIGTKNNEGCLPCLCNPLGSARMDCEQNTGRCLCKNGVTGLKCDKCTDGLILTSEGCVKSDKALPGGDQTESCDTRDCGHAQCVMVDKKPVCTCNYTCSDEPDYICASDGQTYPNICHFRRQACKDGGLVEVMRGPCQVVTSALSVPTPDIRVTPSTTAKTDESSKGRAAERSRSKERAADRARPAVTCTDNPCANGGTCVDNANLGFICSCNVHWQGLKCQQANTFTTPSFSGNSFMQYPWHDGASRSFDLRLTIIPVQNTGIILFAGDETGRRDFMSLVMNEGYVEFRFDNGGGPVLLRSEAKVVTNKRHVITVKKTGKSGQLMVRGQVVITKEAPGEQIILDHLGRVLTIGHARTDFYGRLSKRLLRNLGGVSKGFQGCVTAIHDVVATQNFVLRNEREAGILNGRNIKQCSSDPCLREPCQNGGLCRMINSFVYKCQCNGTYTGENCSAKRKQTRHLISSNWIRGRSRAKATGAAESPRFAGDGYLQYKLPGPVEENLTVSIVFNTAHPDGVLLYGSHSSDGASGDFILLSLESRTLVLRFDLGDGLTELRSVDKVPLKKWNLVSMSRAGKRASLSLNEQAPDSVENRGKMKHLNIRNQVTVGAIPTAVIHNKRYLHSPGFQGVIQRVSINGKVINDFFSSASMAYGVKRYHGPPCHPTPCSQGQRCIPMLDTYRCEP